MKISNLAGAVVLALAYSQAGATLAYDQNVTNNVIFGSGVTNGSFTVDRANGVELGLRGKLRHNASGAPENTFNSNGDGSYSFAAGVAPTQVSPTAVWSFEWSINVDTSGTAGRQLNDLTYKLGIDTDTSLATSFIEFDLIHGAAVYDHSIGDNSTAQSAGVEASDAATYASLIANNNLAQPDRRRHLHLLPCRLRCHPSTSSSATAAARSPSRPPWRSPAWPLQASALRVVVVRAEIHRQHAPRTQRRAASRPHPTQESPARGALAVQAALRYADLHWPGGAAQSPRGARTPRDGSRRASDKALHARGGLGVLSERRQSPRREPLRTKTRARARSPRLLDAPARARQRQHSVDVLDSCKDLLAYGRHPDLERNS